MGSEQRKGSLESGFWGPFSLVAQRCVCEVRATLLMMAVMQLWVFAILDECIVLGVEIGIEGASTTAGYGALTDDGAFCQINAHLVHRPDCRLMDARPHQKAAVFSSRFPSSGILMIRAVPWLNDSAGCRALRIRAFDRDLNRVWHYGQRHV